MTAQDERIEKIWAKHPHYHQIKAEEGVLREKYSQVYSLVTEHLPKEGNGKSV